MSTSEPGVAQHAQALHILRSIAEKGPCAYPGIHGLLEAIEKRSEELGKLPDVIGVQIEDGEDDTITDILAVCELIVSKQLTKKLLLSRIPIGHTNDVIDSSFNSTAVANEKCMFYPHYNKEIVIESLNYSEISYSRGVPLLTRLIIPGYSKYEKLARDLPLQGKNVAELKSQQVTFQSITDKLWERITIFFP